MKKHKKVKIIIAVVSVAVVAALAITAVMMRPANVYARSIQSAQRLADAGKYDEAVLAYTEAIDKNPDEVDGYLALSDLYADHNDVDDAVSLLRTGLSRTNSSRIELALNVLIQDNPDIEETSAKNIEINDTLLNNTADFTYSDFRKQYGISNRTVQDDGSVAVEVRGIEGKVIFANTSSQKTAVSGNNVSDNAQPEELQLDNILTLFNGGSESITYDMLKALNLDDLSMKKDDEHGNVIHFVRNDADVTIACDDSGTITDQSWNKISPVSRKKRKDNQTAAVSGKVLDQKGLGIGKATITVRKGTAQSGSSVLDTTSASDGAYSVDLPAGDYTFEVDATGYPMFYKQVTIDSLKDISDVDLQVETLDLSNKMIIALSITGDNPFDDFHGHLFDEPAGNEFAGTYFGDPERGVTKLQEDDFSQLGNAAPAGTVDVILVDDTMAGTFYYRVHDFWIEERTFAEANCMVTVTMPDGKQQTFTPTNSDLYEWWNVFTIVNGNIQVQDTYTDDRYSY